MSELSIHSNPLSSEVRTPNRCVTVLDGGLFMARSPRHQRMLQSNGRWTGRTYASMYGLTVRAPQKMCEDHGEGGDVYGSKSLPSGAADLGP